jgi:hypothetical protein
MRFVPRITIFVFLFSIAGIGCGGGSMSSQRNSSMQPAITLEASPSTVTSGVTTVLTWKASNTVSVSINGLGRFPATGSTKVTPAVTTTYTAAATGPGGTSSSSTVVHVMTAVDKPTLEFSAQPSNITAGESSTLSWIANNATSVSIAGVGTFPATGSVQVTPTSTYTYAATATGAGGTASSNTTVTVTSEQNPPPKVSASNVDDSMNGWKPVCVLPTCNPGGSGRPTKVSQTIDHSSPSKDGESMELLLAGPKDTNALWTYRAGADDNATSFSMTFWVYPTGAASSAGSFEFDQFDFSSSTGIEFMFGTQCNQVSKLWQVFDQLHNHWMNTAVGCSLPANQWSEVRWDAHRVSGDTNRCDGMPCMYYDSVTVDGTVHPVNAKYPAGYLPHGWSSSVGFQFQIDIGNVGSPVMVEEFLDLADFSAI